MPVLGIVASQLQLESNSFESIATTIVGSGGTSTITFNTIPSGYKSLQIRALSHSTGGTQPAMIMTFNSTSTNYYWHGLEGNGSGTPYGYTAGSLNSGIYIYSTAGSSYNSSIYSAHVIDILDYQNTNKYKTTRSLGGEDANGSGYLSFNSGLWQSTSAINRIDITLASSLTFAENSHFALYGIKG
jgi:hypothetical protein